MAMFNFNFDPGLTIRNVNLITFVEWKHTVGYGG
jgi:hypothetical protein